jgi:hypothetical protein
MILFKIDDCTEFTLPLTSAATVCARNCGLHKRRNQTAIFFSSLALSEPLKLITHHQKFKSPSLFLHLSLPARFHVCRHALFHFVKAMILGTHCIS